MFISYFVITQSLSQQNNLTYRYGLDEMTIHEMISHLEGYSSPDGTLSATIKDRKLTLQDKINKQVITLPKDQFYICVAPYVNMTHT